MVAGVLNVMVGGFNAGAGGETPTAGAWVRVCFARLATLLTAWIGPAITVDTDEPMVSLTGGPFDEGRIVGGNESLDEKNGLGSMISDASMRAFWVSFLRTLRMSTPAVNENTEAATIPHIIADK